MIHDHGISTRAVRNIFCLLLKVVLVINVKRIAIRFLQGRLCHG